MVNFWDKRNLASIQIKRNQQAKSEIGLRQAVSALRFFVLFLELVHAAFGVDKLLLPGKEGMADRADVQFHVFFGGSGLEGFAAGTMDRCYLIVRMNALFHGSDLLYTKAEPQPEGCGSVKTAILY
jgi:hypothetical protein